MNHTLIAKRWKHKKTVSFQVRREAKKEEKKSFLYVLPKHRLRIHLTGEQRTVHRLPNISRKKPTVTFIEEIVIIQVPSTFLSVLWENMFDRPLDSTINFAGDWVTWVPRASATPINLHFLPACAHRLTDNNQRKKKKMKNIMKKSEKLAKVVIYKILASRWCRRFFFHFLRRTFFFTHRKVKYLKKTQTRNGENNNF